MGLGHRVLIYIYIYILYVLWALCNRLL